MEFYEAVAVSIVLSLKIFFFFGVCFFKTENKTWLAHCGCYCAHCNTFPLILSPSELLLGCLPHLMAPCQSSFVPIPSVTERGTTQTHVSQIEHFETTIFSSTFFPSFSSKMKDVNGNCSLL